MSFERSIQLFTAHQLSKQPMLRHVENKISFGIRKKFDDHPTLGQFYKLEAERLKELTQEISSTENALRKVLDSSRYYESLHVGEGRQKIEYAIKQRQQEWPEESQKLSQLLNKLDKLKQEDKELTKLHGQTLDTLEAEGYRKH